MVTTVIKPRPPPRPERGSSAQLQAGPRLRTGGLGDLCDFCESGPLRRECKHRLLAGLLGGYVSPGECEKSFASCTAAHGLDGD